EDVERILEEKDGEATKEEQRAMRQQAAQFADEETDAADATDMVGPGGVMANGDGQAVPVGGGQDGRFSGR
ncbi:hypothetical protein B7486_76540, partial [cyanobacterium TDX16]